MRLGVAGKGGVGKTTIAAVLARALARRGHRVVAIDCDSDPNLAEGLGLGPGEVAALRPFLDQSGPRRSRPDGAAASQLLDGYGLPAPDGVIALLAARAERAGSG
ncbi:MAG: AAA family ATPase [Actinomycetota bacterium]